jgi:regulator of extracellular matrix RemA (YlzA/DUF370 family)
MMIRIGFRNYVNLEKIVSITAPNSSPIKTMINSAREKGKLVDATMGKKTNSVIVTNSDHVVLSANLPDTIVHRIQTVANRTNYNEYK